MLKGFKQLQLLSAVVVVFSVACSPGEEGATVMTPTATAQQEQSADSIPRTPGGKPDMNGIWQVLNNANNNVEPAPPKAAHHLVPGDFVPVPHPDIVAMGAAGAVPASQGVVQGGEIPYTEEARAQQQENRDNWLSRDPEIKCYMPGVPRATYMPHPFQIFQSESAMFFAYSFAGAVRNIYLEDPGPAPVDSWMGQSHGHWEDDTFVVEVTGLNGQTWYDRAGNYRTPNSTVTERYTMVDENTIQYEATIEDPEIYTDTWTMEMPLYRRLEEGFELPQFKCVEFVEELMYGSFRKGEPIEDMGLPF